MKAKDKRGEKVMLTKKMLEDAARCNQFGTACAGCVLSGHGFGLCTEAAALAAIDKAGGGENV